MERQPKRHKILCLSFWTPPAIRPQAILIGKMIPEWIRRGLQPVIVTYEAHGRWDIHAPVYTIPIFLINKYLNKIAPLREYLKWRYYQKTANSIKKIAREHEISIIFSFAKPMDSNIIGAMLKKTLHIPFVSHFSDPWYDDPYKSLSQLSAKFIYLQEKFIIKNSDKVIFTNTAAKELVMKKFPKSWAKKAAVIPHCFNAQDYPEITKQAGGRFVISHIGAFYKIRNPEILFRALKKIIDNSIDFAHKFKVDLIGAANDYAGYNVKNIERLAAGYGLADNIDIIPQVSYQESLQYMKRSDCLMVIDADMPDSPFLPSKLIDYAGSGNVIVGITPAHSPTAKFIRNLGCVSFSYGQIDALAEYLQKLISRKINIEINKKFLNQYSVQNTTAQLANIFAEILNQ